MSGLCGKHQVLCKTTVTKYAALSALSAALRLPCRVGERAGRAAHTRRRLQERQRGGHEAADERGALAPRARRARQRAQPREQRRQRAPRAALHGRILAGPQRGSARRQPAACGRQQARRAGLAHGGRKEVGAGAARRRLHQRLWLQRSHNLLHSCWEVRIPVLHCNTQRVGCNMLWTL
jgi:hypothetical protein